MPSQDHPHLTDSQRDALHALGWRSPSEKRTAARRAWWKKVGTYLAFAAAIIILLKLSGAVTGADKRQVPDSWDCSACAAEWSGYDYADKHGFVRPEQCTDMSDRQRRGCLTYVHEFELIQPRTM